MTLHLVNSGLMVEYQTQMLHIMRFLAEQLPIQPTHIQLVEQLLYWNLKELRQGQIRVEQLIHQIREPVEKFHMN